MATHYYDNYSFDFGVKYIEQDNHKFNEFIDKYASDSIKTWKPTIYQYDNCELIKQSFDDSYYVATPKMTSFAKQLAMQINLNVSTRIDKINKNSNWSLQDHNNHQFQDFDWVILTMPPQQAYTILPDQVNFREELINIEMEKCISIMIGLKNTKIEFDIAKFTNSPIEWIIQNNTKPYRANDLSLVIHANPIWSTENFNEENVLVRLLQSLPFYLEEDIHYQKIHRWRYATYYNNNKPNFCIDEKNKIAISGDWCNDGTVIGSFLAASNLAEHLEKIL